MRVLIDTCIILDVLQKREPFLQVATEVLKEVAIKKCYGLVTAKSITDIYYLLKRDIHDEKGVRSVIKALYSFFEVVDTLAIDCYNAAFSEMNDYEDAVMTETGNRLNVDGIVTRNLRDYKLSCVKAFSPDEFLNYLSNADDIIAHKTAMQDYMSGETNSHNDIDWN